MKPTRTRVEFLDFFVNEIPIRLTQPYSAQEKTILQGLLSEVNRQLEESTVTAKCEEEVDIYTYLPPGKVIALFKTIFYSTNADKPFEATQDDIVALLKNFTPFKKMKRSYIARKVTESVPEDYFPDSLIAELRKFLSSKS